MLCFHVVTHTHPPHPNRMQACGWAYGMNVFDLRRWKEHDITGVYHYWQRQVRGDE